jgi:hypothetical protein
MKRRDIWIFIFALGAVLFSWPFLSLFRYALGMYLFIAWLLFITLIFMTTVFSDKGGNGG